MWELSGVSSNRNSMRSRRSELIVLQKFIIIYILLNRLESKITAMSKISERLLHSDVNSNPKSTVLGRSEIIRIFVFELIGTFILAFGIACTQYVPPLDQKVPNNYHDIFVSLSLYLAIVLCAPFSGGHFNPSVTFGFFMLKDQVMPMGKLITYLVSQFLGAASGVSLAKIIFDC